MEGGFPIIVDGECVGGIGVSGGDWETDARIAQAAVEAIGATLELSDERRTAARRLRRDGLVVGRARRRDRALGQAEDRRLLHALGGEAAKFAAKYGCKAAPSYEAILEDRSIEAIVNTTPNNVHLETTRLAAAAGKHVFLDKPIANTVAEGRAITAACREAGVVLGDRLSAPARGPVPLDPEADRRRRHSGGSSTPRPTSAATASGKIDLGSWRYTAEGMPGGVMLQIGMHYTDVLEYLHRPGQGGERQPRAARAAGRQPRRREPHPRARERRALDGERELRLGVRVLPDERLRQGGERLLRFPPGPALPQARQRSESEPVAVREDRRVRRRARGVRRARRAGRASRRWTARRRRGRSR